MHDIEKLRAVQPCASAALPLSRSQIQNHAAALFRLRLRLALELRSPVERDVKR